MASWAALILIIVAFITSALSAVIGMAGSLVLLGAASGALPPWWVFALAIPASMLGTVAGGGVLDRISDVNFKRWSAWLVTGIGIFYLIQAARLGA